jgi:hypothetical protein
MFNLLQMSSKTVKALQRMLNLSAHERGFNPLTPELNPSAQRCLTRFFTGDFAS